MKVLERLNAAFHSLLSWLRLEEDGKLSLTNVAVYGGIFALAFRGADLASAAAFLVALLNYGHRRVERAKVDAAKVNKSDTEIALSAKVDKLAKTLVVSPADHASLAAEVGSLKAQLGMTRLK